MMILFLSMEVCMKMGDDRVAIWYVNQQLEDIAKERGNPSRMYRKLLQFQLQLVKSVEGNAAHRNMEESQNDIREC